MSDFADLEDHALLHARRILWVVTGEEKTGMLNRLLNGGHMHAEIALVELTK